MLLFAAHDPGVKNHVGPIHRHALNLGQDAKFLDLSSPGRVLDDAGGYEEVSTNQLQNWYAASAATAPSGLWCGLASAWACP